MTTTRTQSPAAARYASRVTHALTQMGWIWDRCSLDEREAVIAYALEGEDMDPVAVINGYLTSARSARA